MEYFPQVNRLSAVVFGGFAMLLAALLTLRVRADEPGAHPAAAKLSPTTPGS